MATEAPTGPWVLGSKCQGWARDPSPSDPHPLFSDTKPSNSLIPFLSFRGSEVRTWWRGQLGSSPGKRHRDLDFAPKPQKDSAKDPGISGEALRPGVEPELRPEGRRSLRMGVRTGGEPAVGGPPAPTLLTCSPPPPRLCSPDHLLLLRSLQKVLLQRWVPSWVVRGGAPSPSAGFPGTLLVPPCASWPAGHAGGGGGGSKVACRHRFAGARRLRCCLAPSLALPAASGPWEAGVRRE